MLRALMHLKQRYSLSDKVFCYEFGIRNIVIFVQKYLITTQTNNISNRSGRLWKESPNQKSMKQTKRTSFKVYKLIEEKMVILWLYL